MSDTNNARLVVGVDASEESRRALRWALAEGRWRRATVELIGVWSYLDQTELTAQGFLPEFDERAATTALHELVATETDGFDDVSVIERALCDLPARALIEAAADADLLVVGARGLGALKGALLGSVSDQCVRHADCPVAVIPGVPETAVPPRNEIVVGIDDSGHAEGALRWALDEAVRREAAVRVVAVWRYPAVTAMGWEFAVLSADDVMAGAEATLDRALEAVGLQEGGVDPEVRRTIREGHAGRSLLEAAEGAALLVVGARGLGGFTGLLLGSTSSYCVHHARGPVIVVR